MSTRRIVGGSTNQSVVIRIVDAADGTPETGVVFNTAGIDLWYRRELAASVDITEATLASLTTSHTDGGFLHINDGYYRLDLPDAAVASGVDGVQIGGTVTGMIVIGLYVELEASIADQVWDEVLTGGTHNVQNSAGRRLRQIEAAFVLHDGTAQAGASNSITLDSGASALDDFYNHTRIVVTDGTGTEQERTVVDYNGTTKVATIAPPWVTVPDGTSVFEMEPGQCHAETGWATIKVGIAAAGTSTTITLNATASALDDFYNGRVVHIDYGTGEGQVRYISDYNGTTKVATISTAWATTPDTTSEYIIEEGHPLLTADVATIEASIAALNDVSASDILGATVAEGFSTAGGAATLAQMLHEIRQGTLDFSIAGTVLTVKQADGSTTAMTFTLDDATNPTSRTRAT